mmetsp:Transcript_6219/g.14300  ORF Transcript_6219/g.14300 Transcript_6219/m.14300 type:complete len:236 (-) Transcript_6219:1563-2270(-)
MVYSVRRSPVCSRTRWASARALACSSVKGVHTAFCCQATTTASTLLEFVDEPPPPCTVEGRRPRERTSTRTKSPRWTGIFTLALKWRWSMGSPRNSFDPTASSRSVLKRPSHMAWVSKAAEHISTTRWIDRKLPSFTWVWSSPNSQSMAASTAPCWARSHASCESLASSRRFLEGCRSMMSKILLASSSLFCSATGGRSASGWLMSTNTSSGSAPAPAPLVRSAGSAGSMVQQCW